MSVPNSKMKALYNESLEVEFTWGEKLICLWYAFRRVVTYRYIKRAIKHWWQRRTRGWDDSETWSFDVTLSLYIADHLERFREVTLGYPAHLTEEEWDATLADMVRVFRRYGDDFYTEPEECGEIKRAFQWLADNYQHLWW